MSEQERVRIGIRVEASDTEPGAIVLTIVAGDWELALAPLGGEALAEFMRQTVRAIATANEHVIPQGPALVEQFTKGT
jgi:hypothetical protein